LRLRPHLGLCVEEEWLLLFIVLSFWFSQGTFPVLTIPHCLCEEECWYLPRCGHVRIVAHRHFDMWLTYTYIYLSFSIFSFPLSSSWPFRTEGEPFIFVIIFRIVLIMCIARAR
jgi:hypothetical protein